MIINPAAGGVTDTDHLTALLTDRIREAGSSCVVVTTREEDDLPALVRAACDRGTKLVIAAGGDGTVGEVVNGLVDTDALLGIVPVGTGNLLARAAGVPRRPDDAIALILGEHAEIGIDTMYSAGRHFVLNISTGISSSSIHDTSPEEKRRFGMLAYIGRIIGHIFGFRSHRFDLLLDGYPRTVDATELLVSNGTLMERLPRVLGPQQTFCDSRIDIYVIYGRSLFDYAVIILRKLFRRPEGDEKFLHFSVSHTLTITAHRRSQLMQGDGEVFSRTPTEVRVIPAAFRLIVPPERGKREQSG